MPALIDNYSAFECATQSQPRVANVRYVTEICRPTTSSTILTFYSEQIKNQRILNLLKEFSILQNNWDEDGALAPNADVLKNASYLAILLGIQGQSIFHAAPGPNGELMLDIRNHKRNRSLEIIFYPHKAVAVTFPKEGKPDQMDFEFGKLPELLQWLNQK